MFDEYYSVSLSFWTRARLAEKARQGHLVGQLPWGYVRDPDSGTAVLDPERASLVRGMYERYATGHESDSTIAAWLNAKGARTVRGRPFGKDTVREMPVNVAYCGYISGLRDKRREIRGRHEPIITEELFDRVQDVRAWRTRVVKPGPPSDEYLLRKLLYCERCGSRMHGTRGSQPAVRRYICSTRRYGNPCGEPIVKAELLEGQIVDWLRTFQPDDDMQDVVLGAIRATTHSDEADRETRRRELTSQLQRLQDLYVIGDLTKPQYVMRRQVLEDELERTGPPADPRLDEAAILLADFARFWEIEPSAAERRKLLASLFERVWAHEGTITAVKPRGPFASYFRAANEHGAESGSDGGQTRQ